MNDKQKADMKLTLEEMQSLFYEYVKGVNVRLENVEKKLENYREYKIGIEDLERKKRHEVHKCPLCLGIGRLSREPFDELMRAGLPTSKECNACNGTGLVWG